MKKLLSLAPLLLVLAACQGVPQAKFTIDFATGKMEWTNPKNTSVEDLDVEVNKTTGDVKMKAKHIISTNDVDVVTSVVKSNAQMTRDSLDAATHVIDTAAKSMMK